MAELVRTGDSIEGESIDGHSRKPLVLIPRGPARAATERYVFSARFDVKAEIGRRATPPPALAVAASLDPADKIICEQAEIVSLDDKPAGVVTAKSGTHQAKTWHFSKRTAVTVTAMHPEIQAAIQKRARKNASA